jgi:hypothetical protein
MIMNDDSELMTAVRDSVTRVHTATPVDEIVTRGRELRARRARRRIPGVAGGMAVVAGAALAAVTLVPGGHHPAGSSSSAEMAAWTVAKQADGNVRVTLRQLRDPTGLQSRLRADGVPASVSFSGRMNRSCQLYPVGTALNRVFTSSGSGSATVVIIHLSALPSGAGVAINPPAQPALRVAIGLVRTSRACTGS